MKHECSIVQDLLPLYAEHMVSKDTAEFIKEHLDGCADCRDALAGLSAEPSPAPQPDALQQVQALTAVKKSLRKKTNMAVVTTTVFLLAAALLLYLFPVYRIAKVQTTNYYAAQELTDLVYVGSLADRLTAQAVLRQADAAFADCSHTYLENQQLYGALSRYATAAERDADFTEYTLELWSAHLGEDTGTLWVYYSKRAYDESGSVISGSRNVPSYWTVEKNTDGQWVVTDIKERA